MAKRDTEDERADVDRIVEMLQGICDRLDALEEQPISYRIVRVQEPLSMVGKTVDWFEAGDVKGDAGHRLGCASIVGMARGVYCTFKGGQTLGGMQDVKGCFIPWHRVSVAYPEDAIGKSERRELPKPDPMLRAPEGVAALDRANAPQPAPSDVGKLDPTKLTPQPRPPAA